LRRRIEFDFAAGTDLFVGAIDEPGQRAVGMPDRGTERARRSHPLLLGVRTVPTIGMFLRANQRFRLLLPR